MPCPNPIIKFKIKQNWALFLIVIDITVGET